MTHYTPEDILNFLKQLLPDDQNLENIEINPENAPLNLVAGSSTVLNAHMSITIKLKDISKQGYFNTVHDALKEFLKDNAQSFNLIQGNDNTLYVLFL